MLIVLVWCLGLIVFSSSEINYESEHVLTVCDAFTIWHTQKGEPIPECPQLPLATGFFYNLTGKVYEKQCEINVTTTSFAQAGLLIERSVLIVKRLVDGVKERLEQLGVALVFAAEDVCGLSSVGERWNHRVFSILAGSCFVVFHLQCKKFNPLLFNVFLSLLTSGVFYFVHLYYQNWLITWFFIVVAIFADSPLYLQTWLPSLGVVTFIHLAIPLLGLILRLVIEAQLFFGPMLSLVINGFSILINVLCLIGLYVDEKLLIFKVLLLPLYQTFMSLFDNNDRHSDLVDSIRQSVDDMTTGLLSSTDFKNKSAQQLNEMLTGRMRQLCTNVTTSWYKSCPVVFAQSCSAYINQTELTKLDQGFEAAGKWLTSLITPSGTGSVQRTLSKQICQQISNSACRIIDVAAYCSAPNETLYGQAYHTFLTAVEKLKASVVVQPWLQLNLTLFNSGPTVHILFDTDWVMIGRSVVSFFLVISALFLLFRGLIQSVVFVHRYRTDFLFSFSEMSSLSWTSIFNITLLVKVVLLFLSEWVMRWTHEELQKIQFIEPEQGDARLAFNVQGNGTIARIMSSVLGGFSLQSKYCTKVDSSVCMTPFFPVGWSTWVSLFSLTGFYILTGLYKKISFNYFMCQLCDRFIPRLRKKRIEVKQKTSREEHRRKLLIIQTLAKEELSKTRLKDNQLTLRFFCSPRRWYHHKLTPTIVQSMIAYYKFGVENIFCQICFHNVISSYFRCKTLLFCEKCNNHLKRCPCGCSNRHKITVHMN